jgi:diaminohydroxyphosphoribosylaminopyrimidine deaminase/5-amino-6-(5-phosphoribosylamino)uracil reductase
LTEDKRVQACAASVVAGAFRQALAAAEAFAGATAPNPPVGCVALDAQGQVLACEAHQRAGGPHAEAAAIEACRRAGVVDRIATLVVTLEPCNHFGRTPPCAEAILATPAKTVWIGAADPNGHVTGGGAQRLAAQGLDVRWIEHLPRRDAAVLALAARRLIAPFHTYMHSGRPWLTIKQAVAADGGMVPPPGCKTFTSAKSLALAHALRRRADAIITGSGCVLADDPAFTVRRVPDHPGKQRRLAILDRRRRTPDAYLRAARARGFDVALYDDLGDVLADLHAGGAMEALVEAGPTLMGAMLARGLWDEQVVIRQSAVPGQPDTVEVRTREPV